MELTSKGKLPRMVKERIIQEYLSGSKTARMLSEEYGMSRNALNHMISRHKNKFMPNFEHKPILTPMKPKTTIDVKCEALNKENLELRRQLAMAQLKLEGYEIMSEILEEQYGIDLLKKAGAKQSRVSKRDDQK